MVTKGRGPVVEARRVLLDAGARAAVDLLEQFVEEHPKTRLGAGECTTAGLLALYVLAAQGEASWRQFHYQRWDVTLNGRGWVPDVQRVQSILDEMPTLRPEDETDLTA